ncbi:ATP-binding protein [Pseudenhygromyxa sp. WMMC2535]|uniref:AAA family ATPase n=1 Tax=Pseudenhygromyxa sp. WMMC2535 TaxID=2712867 RepID=UPI0015547DA8|nr:AAA family ATPase [Pseudenhygromyxa sp. WMMC2535]NVB38580.1 ATP-binding protein [Pseudenhygromyxa sp. WMMC2535]
MARADLLKKLFETYQRRDDAAFRSVADEIIEEERKKQHPVLANELQRILANGVRSLQDARGLSSSFDPVPMDSDRRTPLLAIRTPDRYFEDLVLDEGTRSVLDRVMVEVRGWEILEANGLTPTRRLLFCGPSGCGKTACAEAVAAELGLPMLYVRFDSVVSSLLGETAANIRKVFDYANRGQWVVFFDEFDAIGRSRDDATEHGEIKRVVNSFLQLLDSFDGRSLVIAATNFEQVLDPAIWRRFDDVVRFDLPDAAGLEALVRKRLRPLQVTKKQVSSVVEAIGGASFAEAERVCLDARKRCALEGTTKLRNEDIKAALERFRYRRDVLERATPTDSAPSVDRE